MVNVNESEYITAPKILEETLEIAEEIQELVEELPGRAEDFGMSVADQAADIAKDVEEKGRVTKKQLAALSNMRDGCVRWLDR